MHKHLGKTWRGHRRGGECVSDVRAGAGSTLRAILETLAGAPLPAWDSLTPHLQVVRLRKGATLFDVGSHAPHFYVVRRGTVIISAPDAQGREWIVNFCEPGDAVASMSSLAPLACVASSRCTRSPRSLPFANSG